MLSASVFAYSDRSFHKSKYSQIMDTVIPMGKTRPTNTLHVRMNPHVLS